MSALLGSNEMAVRGMCIQTLNVETSHQDIIPCQPHCWISPTCPCQVSGAWLLAVIHTHPEFITQRARLSDAELLEVKTWVISQIFSITTRLITRAKKEVATFSERLFLYECLATFGTLGRSRTSWFVCLQSLQKAITELVAKNGADVPGFESLLEDNVRHLEESVNQQEYLTRFCEHWTKKLFDKTMPGLYKMPFFCLGVLYRLDLSQELPGAQDPVKQALRFVSHFPETADAESLAWKLQNMSLEEEPSRIDKDMNWMLAIDHALERDELSRNCGCTCRGQSGSR
jgi:hypothetical protein